MGQVLQDGTVVLDKPNEIAFARMATLKAGLKLEMIGMRKRGQSCYAILKHEYGLKGTKQEVFNQVQAMVDKELGD